MYSVYTVAVTAYTVAVTVYTVAVTVYTVAVYTVGIMVHCQLLKPVVKEVNLVYTEERKPTV